MPVDALGMGAGGGDEKEVEAEEAIMCWVCKVEPRLSVKCRCCKECKQDWDCFEKDAKRKKELEYLKEFKLNSTEDQMRRLFFAWKKCRVRSGAGVSKCMFPWAAVHRSWAIRKALTEGKGGKMKVYHSFCKYYVEKKRLEHAEGGSALAEAFGRSVMAARCGPRGHYSQYMD